MPNFTIFTSILLNTSTYISKTLPRNTFLANWLTIPPWAAIKNLTIPIFSHLIHLKFQKNWCWNQNRTWCSEDESIWFVISTKSTLTPGAASHGPGTSASGALAFSTIYPTRASFDQFSGMPGGHRSNAITLPSSLMLESLNSSGDCKIISNSSTQQLVFNWTWPSTPILRTSVERKRVAFLHNVVSGAADFALLADALRQNYTTSDDILRARLKPGSSIRNSKSPTPLAI